ncbi:hypothetical protein HanRHA438_Chr15g0695561 [Helianthus annuus]|nr:hypothetical protein HanRHA438_Chr15g0695561 [Helianthus annuus]
MTCIRWDRSMTQAEIHFHGGFLAVMDGFVVVRGGFVAVRVCLNFLEELSQAVHHPLYHLRNLKQNYNSYLRNSFLIIQVIGVAISDTDTEIIRFWVDISNPIKDGSCSS